MHVVAVTPLYPPGSRVGAWLATHECLAALARRGHSVEVARYLGTGETYELDGVVVYDKRATGRVDNADIIVSHCGDNGKAHARAVELGIPSVKMVHGYATQSTKRLDGASLAVFNSEASRHDLEHNAPSIVVHPVTWAEQHRTTPGDRITLVNLSKEKGGHLFYTLARSLPAHDFLGVRGAYGRQRSSGAPLPNVETIGTTENMRDDVWSRTRVLLMPSAREAWGMVGVEAMTSGIPVIANPTPGIREALGDAAIYADRDRPAEWKLAIERLDDPTRWGDASARALARVRELDPVGELERFALAVEELAKVAA